MQLRDPETISVDTASGLEGAASASSAARPVAPCPILALSDDPLLLEALAGLGLAGTGVLNSPSSDRFIDQLVANSAGSGIAIIDAGSVSTGLKSFLATLREQFPQLLVMLAGPAHLQAQFEAQIADGAIFRFVHKPASTQRLRLFIDAAVRKLAIPDPSQAPLPAATPMPIPVPASAAAPRSTASVPPAGERRRGFPPAVAALGLLILGAAGWAVWHYVFAPAAEPTAPVAPPTAGETLPEPSSAATAPDATATLPVATDKPNMADASHDNITHDSAARDAARTAAQLEQAQRSAQGARADQVSLYVQLARKRLASGALVEPADDSARGYLESATSLAPDDPDVRTASIALGEAMIVQFRHAIAAGDLAESQRWFKVCSDYRIGSATLSDLSAQLQKLQSAKQNEADAAMEQALERARAATPSAAPPPAAATVITPAASTPSPTAPAAAAAAPSAPAAGPAPTWVPESTLTRVLFVPPSYPDEALSRNISGWVDLEFTVTPEGKVADITVLTAEPSGMFDRAARTALARSRYHPVTRDGIAVAQRARIRVRFKQ
jgi:periplasmic protein TonB